MTKHKLVENFNTEEKSFFSLIFYIVHASIITKKSDNCLWSNALELSRYYKNLKEVFFLAEGRGLRVSWLIRADELTNHLKEYLSDIINKILFHSISFVNFTIP